MTTLNQKQLASYSYIRWWLLFVAALVFAMVIVGGATRLTDSGLSITEWKPLLGAIPPLSDAHWLESFEKYRQIPEYKLINKGMSLDEFKFIYWWEWGHRFLGRAIGLVFFVPFVFFWLTGRLHRSLVPPLLLLFVLGGLQGALGWYMVMSGLVERTDVSQYRLSAHLTLATVIFAAIVWTALGIGRDKRRPASSVNLGWPALALILLIIVQTALGGFVAGLDAGLSHNTWPLMDGRLIPNGLLAMEPAWRNFFENVLTVQFQHRMVAYAIAVLALVHAARALNEANPSTVQISGFVILFAVLAQIAFGIWTLLAQVPITLGLVHQGGALIVLAACIWHLHEVCLAPQTTVSSAAQPV
jgi:cytochrome c oxidase assembly protein subunit 15